jgi:hypothetical protein
MATTTTARTAVPLLTYADLDAIPKEREGDRHELFDGVLVVTPSPIPAHRLVSTSSPPRTSSASVGSSSPSSARRRSRALPI